MYLLRKEDEQGQRGRQDPDLLRLEQEELARQPRARWERDPRFGYSSMLSGEGGSQRGLHLYVISLISSQRRNEKWES